ncbi:purine and uridine phosphorylase [Aspergillus ellipticus CBS 707.79]|uniref:Purine and uridine phosphorylase n=1 Tax=Aspergillus ellipticus CBS 707.79 TaxID=1448320 RepID=A0A319DCR2_9EURO|nr:purine and uridine phosphorylase [Aspergillus ellipticus CBS 707.79]
MLTHDDYLLGWVCALPLEMAAAQAMLDEKHPELPSPSTDDNAYMLGAIAGHNVVIAGLPSGSYGTNSATRVLSQMRSTFPRLEVGLMVGIRGGVPSDSNDIRLGDVVVSKPTGSCGGVVRYDSGKALQGGRFEHTGSLNQPPQLLLTHLSLLQAEMMGRTEEADGLIWSGVQKVLGQNPHLQRKFGCPGPDQDTLFSAKYPHSAEGGLKVSCARCDRHQTVSRTLRSSMEPHVHYGIIVSGDQVMKDSEARDRLDQELGILCFEMEAAGLMNQLPSLVVRGICDYFDSHKNKEWQGYAALTAAVYSKLFLSRLKPRTLKQWNKPRSLSLFAIG